MDRLTGPSKSSTDELSWQKKAALLTLETEEDVDEERKAFALRTSSLRRSADLDPIDLGSIDDPAELEAALEDTLLSSPSRERSGSEPPGLRPPRGIRPLPPKRALSGGGGTRSGAGGMRGGGKGRGKALANKPPPPLPSIPGSPAVGVEKSRRREQGHNLALEGPYFHAATKGVPFSPAPKVSGEAKAARRKVVFSCVLDACHTLTRTI